MLVKVSSGENNNKFYEVTLAADGTVSKRWGRIGTTGQSGVEASGKAGFDRLVAAKTKKGYKQVKVADAGGAKAAGVEDVRRVSRSALAADAKDARVLSLIDRLVEKNKHEILAASGGKIEVSTSGVLQTPLGIIEPSSIAEARELLDELEKPGLKAARARALLDEYLTLVPQELPRARGWEADFFKEHPISDQRDLLTQLSQSFEWYEAEREAAEKRGDGDTVDYSNFFKYRIRMLSKDDETDRKEFRRIERMFKESRNTKHHKDVASKRLHAVYLLDGNGSEAEWHEIAKKLGNVQQLWHGTGVANLLSILRTGLYVPPVSTASMPIAGRMWGDGVYHSSQSTKALRYSTGAWHHSKENDCFMFLNEVVCGKEFHPKSTRGYQRAYATHNSIYVDPGAGVLNNEVIVWEPKQVRLRWLCEFK